MNFEVPSVFDKLSVGNLECWRLDHSYNSNNWKLNIWKIKLMRFVVDTWKGNPPREQQTEYLFVVLKENNHTNILCFYISMSPPDRTPARRRAAKGGPPSCWVAIWWRSGDGKEPNIGWVAHLGCEKHLFPPWWCDVVDAMASTSMWRYCQWLSLQTCKQSTFPNCKVQSFGFTKLTNVTILFKLHTYKLPSFPNT